MKQLSFFLISFFLLLACSKQEPENIYIDGIYQGTFTVKYLNTPEEHHPTTIEFQQSNFACTTRGSGTFTQERFRLQFCDKNYWTAEFDWNLILNGTYNYVIQGDSIRIWKDVSTGHYEYNIKKQ